MTLKKEVPIDFVIRLLEVQLKNITNTLLMLGMMQNFMQGQNTIHDVPMLNKSILALADKFVSKQLNSVVKHLCEKFIWTSKKTNRAELLNFLGTI